MRLTTLASLFAAACGPGKVDQDGDGYSAAEGDCVDTDAGVAPNVEDIPGDGIDSDCDGTDLNPVPISNLARGTVFSTVRDHSLGYVVSCGPDVDGNGLGDLAFNAAAFTFSSATAPQDAGAAYRTNGPLTGSVDERHIEGWTIREGDLPGPRSPMVLHS